MKSRTRGGALFKIICFGWSLRRTCNLLQRLRISFIYSGLGFWLRNEHQFSIILNEKKNVDVNVTRIRRCLFRRNTRTNFQICSRNQHHVQERRGFGTSAVFSCFQRTENAARGPQTQTEVRIHSIFTCTEFLAA